MKRAFFIFTGALALLGCGVLAVTALSGWVADNLIHGDDDMNTVGKITFLAIYPLLLGIGGWLGNVIYKRRAVERQHETGPGSPF